MKFFKNKFFLFGVGGLSALFLVLVFLYFYVAFFMPLPAFLADIRSNATTKVFDRNGVLLYEVLKPKEGLIDFVPIERFPDDFINATLASEDVNFFHHDGVDLGAILRAVFLNLREFRIVSGGSTITQQVVRNFSGLNTRRSDFFNKFKEIAYAIRVSHLYSKDAILELYLNKIYYGNMFYGAQAASLGYFGKNVYDLDLAESTLLVGLPQSPSFYNPFVNFDNAKVRQKYVLDQMFKYDFISEDDSVLAFNEKLQLHAEKDVIKAPHFVRYVLNKVEEMYGEDAVLNGGLSITTTLDYSLQEGGLNIVRRHVDNLEDKNAHNGALLALDVKSGQILAWIGSVDYFDESIDGAVDMITSLRQPGSSIKPLNYLLAFEKGYSPATVIFDVPSQFSTASGGYTPKNYDLDFHGPISARVALASSFNVPAVKVLDFVGINNFINFLYKVGISSFDKPASFYGLALTLGSGEVRPIDLARAYNVIANYGEKFDSSVLLSVVDKDGNELFSYHEKPHSYVLGNEGKQHAYQIIDILKDDSARSYGFGLEGPLNIGVPAAVKTGTTRNFRDNWTVGFSPDVLVLSWVGNADAELMKNISGVDGAAPVWHDFMKFLLAGKSVSSFYVPEGLYDTEICSVSGKLPSALCKDISYELLTKKQVPSAVDDFYKVFHINKVSGLAIAEECLGRYPASLIEDKVLIDYPSELFRWAVWKGLEVPHFERCGVLKVDDDGYSNDKAEKVSMASPLNNDEFMIDYSMPLDDQKIPLRVDVPSDVIDVSYFLDGEKVGGSSSVPFSYLWLAKSGWHSVYVVAEMADGGEVRSDAVRFRVIK